MTSVTSPMRHFVFLGGSCLVQETEKITKPKKYMEQAETNEPGSNIDSLIVYLNDLSSATHNF